MLLERSDETLPMHRATPSGSWLGQQTIDKCQTCVDQVSRFDIVLTAISWVLLDRTGPRWYKPWYARKSFESGRCLALPGYDGTRRTFLQQKPDALGARALRRANSRKIMTAKTKSADEPTAVPVSVWLRGAVADAFLQAVNDANDTRAGFVRKMIAGQLRVAGYLPALKATHRTANRAMTETAR